MSAAARRRAPRGSGDQLREEIITAVKELLVETDSVEAISIRAVAQRVGVTAPSIYLHFADKDALLDAVVTDVFTQLETVIAEAGADAETPSEKLLAEGLAYVHFALAHKEHYRVALMAPYAEPPDVDAVIRAGAFAQLQQTVTECMDAGLFPKGDPLPISLSLWTAAHGIASLVIAKPYLPWGDVDELARRTLTAAALGYSVEQ